MSSSTETLTRIDVTTCPTCGGMAQAIQQDATEAVVYRTVATSYAPKTAPEALDRDVEQYRVSLEYERDQVSRWRELQAVTEQQRATWQANYESVSGQMSVLADRLDAREREIAELPVTIEKRLAERVFEAIPLDPNDGDTESADPVDWIVTAVHIALVRKDDEIDALTALAEQAEREREWQPIQTAPRDGTHILACDASRGYGERWTFNQAPPTVVHYWGNPGEEGFYTSVNELAPERTFTATHWMPLPAPPASSSRGSADHA